VNNIISKLRDLIDDGYKFVNESQEYFGSSKIFTLQYANIDATTLIVKKNGTIWAGTNYSYSSSTGKVTVTGTLTSGDVLTFEYNAYEKYSDSELRAYIRNAIYHLAIEKYKVFTAKSDNIIFPTPSESEECLLSIVAAILIKGNIRQYRTPEFTIVFDTDNMSVEKKIKATLQQFKKTFGQIAYIGTDEQLPEPTDN
jgi:hypothetical protein